MKTSIKTALSALVVTAAVAAPAVANLSGQSLHGAIQSAITGGTENVKVEDSVADFFGCVEDKTSKRTFPQMNQMAGETVI